MDSFFYYLYWFYSWFVYLGSLCRRKAPYYYLVDTHGNQYPLTDANLAHYGTLFVIYYTTAGTKYRFHPIVERFKCTAAELRSAYVSFSEPTAYKLFAVNLAIQNQTYTVNAIEFNIVGNEIFSPIFNKWLCRNYLHIEPCDTIDVSYFDDNTAICNTKGPMRFYETKLILEPLTVD